MAPDEAASIAHQVPPDEAARIARQVPPDEAARIARQVAGHPYFDGFAEDDLAALVACGEIIEAPAGARLIRQGDPGTFALLVLEGSATVIIDTPYDRVELATFEAPAVLGEIGAFTGVAPTAHVDAGAPVRAVRLSAQALEAAGRAHPALLSAVMRQFGQRFETFNRAFGFYANALSALERLDFDLRLLDELRNPLPELTHFAHSFRRLAEAIMTRAAERQEMANAAAIQRSMLPPPLAPDALGGRADIFAAMLPAQDVGGDFYDYFLIDPTHLVVTLGDVAGKGTPAALFMSATQTALRMGLRSAPDVARAVAAVNDLLYATNGETLFVTLFCAVLDLSTGDLTYCNSGHTDCVLLRAGGAVEQLSATGMALAILEGAKARAVTTHLGPGDRLFLFSDGLTDAIDAGENAFGQQRLEQTAASALPLPPEAFIGTVLDAACAHAGDTPQFDDMTVLAVTFTGG